MQSIVSYLLVSGLHTRANPVVNPIVFVSLQKGLGHTTRPKRKHSTPQPPLFHVPHSAPNVAVTTICELCQPAAI